MRSAEHRAFCLSASVARVPQDPRQEVSEGACSVPCHRSPDDAACADEAAVVEPDHGIRPSEPGRERGSMITVDHPYGTCGQPVLLFAPLLVGGTRIASEVQVVQTVKRKLKGTCDLGGECGLSCANRSDHRDPSHRLIMPEQSPSPADAGGLDAAARGEILPATSRAPLPRIEACRLPTPSCFTMQELGGGSGRSVGSCGDPATRSPLRFTRCCASWRMPASPEHHACSGWTTPAWRCCPSSRGWRAERAGTGSSATTGSVRLPAFSAGTTKRCVTTGLRMAPSGPQAHGAAGTRPGTSSCTVIRAPGTSCGGMTGLSGSSTGTTPTPVSHLKTSPTSSRTQPLCVPMTWRATGWATPGCRTDGTASVSSPTPMGSLLMDLSTSPRRFLPRPTGRSSGWRHRDWSRSGLGFSRASSGASGSVRSGSARIDTTSCRPCTPDRLASRADWFHKAVEATARRRLHARPPALAAHRCTREGHSHGLVRLDRWERRPSSTDPGS